jgi:carbon-monoxide dehydrogenase small subunit
VNSCLIPIVQAEGVKIRTIEGVADKTKLSKIQEAFINNNGAQCGICTPGMVLASINLLSKNKKPNQLEIKEALAGNLCRCTGYMKIFDAIRDTMNSGGKSK